MVAILTSRVNLSSFLDERGIFHSGFSAAATHHKSRDQRLPPIWLRAHNPGRHRESGGAGTHRAVSDVFRQGGDLQRSRGSDGDREALGDSAWPARKIRL